MATTKGAVLRALLKFVETDLTPDQFGRAIAALPEADRAIVGQPSILPSLKVSEFVLNRLTVEAARAKGEPLESFARRAGEAELKAAVGIYRFFTFVLTPTAIVKKAATIWSTIHSHGNLVFPQALAIVLAWMIAVLALGEGALLLALAGQLRVVRPRAGLRASAA